MALWTVHGDGRRLTGDEVVHPHERVSWPLTIGLGLQHLVAMFGATVLVPLLTGFPMTTTLLFSGLGTLLFLLFTRNRIPAYLGSSVAFVLPLAAAANDGLAAQVGGVLFAGLLVAVVGIAVKALGVRLLEAIMPPVVTGAVVLLLSLNLAPAAAASIGTPGQPILAAVTLVVVGLCATLARGIFLRLGLLFGMAVGWLVGASAGLLEPAKLAALRAAPWFGTPELTAPQLRPSVMAVMLPAVLVLAVQTVGQVKAIGATTGRDLDGNIGDALIAGGLATALSGAGGGSGLTMYAENTGVLIATKVYSTATYAVAALGAVLLSFSPKVAAFFATVPTGVVGGAALVLYGLVAMIGVRIWLDNRVDLRDPVNLLVAGAAVIAGAGNLTIQLGWLQLGGAAWGAMLIVLGHPLLRMLRAARR